MHETQSWFAGVDWASQKHEVWLADASGKCLGKRSFEHSGEGLAHMCAWLIVLMRPEEADADNRATPSLRRRRDDQGMPDSNAFRS